MKKLLILGATSETDKLVQKAESMGIETYVADPNEDAHAKKYASHPILMDCFDVDEKLYLAEMTFYSGGGYSRIPQELDEAWGEKFVLPPKSPIGRKFRMDLKYRQ